MAFAAIAAVFGGLEFLLGSITTETVATIATVAGETVLAETEVIALEFPVVGKIVTDTLATYGPYQATEFAAAGEYIAGGIKTAANIGGTVQQLTQSEKDE